MNPPTILISRYYSTVTPESAEDGDIEDSGEVYTDTEFTFRELVREMRDFSHASQAPGPVSNVNTWLSSGYEDVDYRTGEAREETLHFSRENPERLGKYWIKAAKAAGIQCR